MQRTACRFNARTLSLVPSRNSDARKILLRSLSPEYADGTLTILNYRSANPAKDCMWIFTSRTVMHATSHGHISVLRQRASANSKYCQREALPGGFTTKTQKEACVLPA